MNLFGWLRSILPSGGQTNSTTLNQILAKVNAMPSMSDFQAAQVTLDTKIDALITAFNASQANVAALTAAVTAAQGDPVAIQAAIDDATNEGSKIDAALGATVPSSAPATPVAGSTPSA